MAKTVEDFASVMERVATAAGQWGIRKDDAEGRFVSAMLGAIRWSGEVSQAAQAEFRALGAQQDKLAKLELSRAQELAKATTATLAQARSAIINLQVERELLATRMASETMPLFADKIQKVLAIRVKEETAVQRFRRVLLAGGLTLLVFMTGFAFRSWQDGAQLGALANCLSHPLAGQGGSQGHVYCDVTSFRDLGG